MAAYFDSNSLGYNHLLEALLILEGYEPLAIGKKDRRVFMAVDDFAQFAQFVISTCYRDGYKVRSLGQL